MTSLCWGLTFLTPLYYSVQWIHVRVRAILSNQWISLSHIWLACTIICVKDDTEMFFLKKKTIITLWIVVTLVVKGKELIYCFRVSHTSAASYFCAILQLQNLRDGFPTLCGIMAKQKRWLEEFICLPTFLPLSDHCKQKDELVATLILRGQSAPYVQRSLLRT